MRQTNLTRRELIAGAAGLALHGARAAQGAPEAFAFPLLGDLHFDRLEHHDMAWLEREKPNDVSQVKNYSRLTQEVLPGLLTEVRQAVAGAKSPIPFVVQVGDLVEGLCGTPDLARRHCEEAVAFVREAKLGAPVLFTKGNHDVTGPGSVEAFDQVLLPFLSQGSEQELKSASYTVEKGDSLFVYFDAYSRDSLPWLEKTLADRKPKRLFFVVHLPVVPFGARASWHLFNSPRQQPERERLLRLLGRHRAIVLCGHLHKFGTVVRRTEEGPFVQLMVSSIIPKRDAAPRDHLQGVDRYHPELVKLEPNFSPTTEAERREILRAEAPLVRQFEYADAPGYAVVTVDGASVKASCRHGLGKGVWQEVDLSGLLDA
jgi:hypothetical protein